MAGKTCSAHYPRAMKFVELSSSGIDRRDFLAAGGTASAFMALFRAMEARAQEAPEGLRADATPPIKCGVIGCGPRGREVISTLALLPSAPLVAVCEHYPALLSRAQRSAPKAKAYATHAELLADKEVEAVIIATPTHQHRQIVADALKAGKHIYCEAPLAHTVEDTLAIAASAKANPRFNFQSGLQLRSEPQRHFLLPFIRAGGLGSTIKARVQWHKKQSWRQISPNAEREKEINWRLDQKLSPGLMGELGLHQADEVSWFYNMRPRAVTGFGSLTKWKDDGRKVPDSVQAVFEYPGGVHLSQELTIANSFDSEYELFYGTDSAIMLRGTKAWMFKETDAPLIGWEVYARKDQFFSETGIALVANATKLAAKEDAVVLSPFQNTPLYYALEAFAYNTHQVKSAVEDFVQTFGESDAATVAEHLSKLKESRLPAADVVDGAQATVVALKANESILTGKRIEFQDEWFKI